MRRLEPAAFYGVMSREIANFRTYWKGTTFSSVLEPIVYLLAFGPGLALGGWEASVPARLESFGWEPATAGPLLALAALGSGLAGLVAANLRDPLRYGRAMAAGLLLMFALSFVPTAVAGSVLVLAAGLFVVGVPIAPLNALASLSLQRIVAEPRQAEGFALYPAMILIGAGTGQAIAGIALRVLSPAAFMLLLAAVPAALGAVVLGAMAGVGFGLFQAVNRRINAVIDVYRATLAIMAVGSGLLVGISAVTEDGGSLPSGPPAAPGAVGGGGLGPLFLGLGVPGGRPPRPRAARGGGGPRCGAAGGGGGGRAGGG